MSRVRVGIVSWNTAALLDRCLAALPSALEGSASTIVVVDNASSDESASVAARHPDVRLICNDTNRGYARAMNQALAGCDADVLIALNPDTEPGPRSLTVLAERLLGDPTVGLVAPRLINPDGTLQHSVHRFPSPRQAAAVLLTPARMRSRAWGARWWVEGHARHDHAVDIDWAIGAVHVIRSEALGHRPPYDDRWFMYVEDLDLCWRLDRSGWRRRLEPDVSVVHVGNAAGAQAWGDQRTERWMAASYDWYDQTFGTRARRRWAAVNTIAVATHLAAACPRAMLGSPQQRQRVRELARSLPLQMRAWLGSGGEFERVTTSRPAHRAEAPQPLS